MPRTSLAQVDYPFPQPLDAPATVAALSIHDPAVSQPAAGFTERGPTEIMCPLTGELVSTDDVDGLIDCFERLDNHNKAVYQTLIQLRLTLAGMTDGDARTRRVRGVCRIAAIEFPADSWEQPILKAAWAEFEAFRDEYLKIDVVGVKLREYKKLVNMTGPKEFERFRDLLTAANRGCTGTPAVKVEK